MSLRQQARADALRILEDLAGFGWQITVTTPNGVELEMVGRSTDVAMALETETGQLVSTRRASVALATQRFDEAGTGLPSNVVDKGLKPWLVRFADIGGTPHVFKVSQTHPDRTVGVIVCELEVYKP
ncbi:MAG: hypothetical protein JNM74_02385 [Myxococcales bacterium]|nr:hypothetical protein [Myxococcales bacterium]